MPIMTCKMKKINLKKFMLSSVQVFGAMHAVVFVSARYNLSAFSAIPVEVMGFINKCCCFPYY